MNRKIPAILIGLFFTLGMFGCTQTEANTSTANSQSSSVESLISSQPAESAASEQSAASAASDQTTANTEKAAGEVITEAQAKTAALEIAGLNEADVTFMKVKLEMDDGRHIYDIEFYAGNTEYDFEIDASTGTVLSYDNDYEGSIKAATSTVQGSDIGINAAQEIALAKVSGATADNIRIYQAYDDGISVYEGTIVYNEQKYDFEIKADDGTILEWEVESVYDD